MSDLEKLELHEFARQSVGNMSLIAPAFTCRWQDGADVRQGQPKDSTNHYLPEPTFAQEMHGLIFCMSATDWIFYKDAEEWMQLLRRVVSEAKSQGRPTKWPALC